MFATLQLPLVRSLASSIMRLVSAHWALWAACALFLLVAAFVFDDYYEWGDTPAQRAIGNAALDYLAGDGERAFNRLLFAHDRYYGTVFEAPLALLTERIPGLGDAGDIVLARHLLTHLFFLTGGVFCYLLVLRLFGSRALALVAMVLFLLHPRIYAHSFFNSKDPPFLTAFMIALYLVHRAFRRDTLAAFLLCGVGAGLLVNLRIMGLVLPAVVLALRTLDLALAGNMEERKRVLLTMTAFTLAAILAYYASLPVLWTDPVGRFADLIRTLGSHPYTTSSNVFRGVDLQGRDGVPWDYAPVWLGVTTPPATLLLALLGTVSLAWRGFRQPRDIFRNETPRMGMLLIALPVVTVVAIVVLESNIYHDWRQLYFLYAPVPLLGAFGLHWMTSSSSGFHKQSREMGIYILAGAGVAVAIVSMVRIHPYQAHHFTFLEDRTTPEGLISHHNDWVVNMGHVLEKGNAASFTISKDIKNNDRFFAFVHPFLCSYLDFTGVYSLQVYATTVACGVAPDTYVEGIRKKMLTAEPLVRSFYHIYRESRNLFYVRERCGADDVSRRFLLHVFPVDAGDLHSSRRMHGFDNHDTRLWRTAVRFEGTCVAFARLPDYPISHIRTGYSREEYPLWEAMLHFDGRDPLPPPDYADARRKAIAGDPLARSVFDVYLVGRALTYLRDECTDEDVAPLFFLHAVPVDAGDLPEHRREHGFDNRDFVFTGLGARQAGSCVVVVPLPDYPIASIQTGQYDETGTLWLVEFALPDAK